MMAVYRGTDGADNRTGTSLNDRLYGLLGNDTLKGAAGDDYLSGGRGDDSLDGGVGRDQLDGGDGADVLFGGDGDDYLDGGQDSVRDKLYGGAGDDIVQARANDVADGGAGDVDTLILTTDFADIGGDATLYRIDLSGIDGPAFASTGFAAVKAMNFEQANVVIADAAARSTITGSKGHDVIAVSVAEGQTSGVTIRGGAGNDELTGSSLNDVIYGDAGEDIIDGGAGADVLFGGAGSDLFHAVLEFTYPGGPKQAIDTIRDFDADDYILVTDEIYTGFGPSFETLDLTNPFVFGAAPKANSTGGQFLYNTTSGLLSYDPDGKGSEAAIALYKLAGAPVLTVNDFILDI
ncbi:hemolysin-type calcium-binding protein [Methylopila sp. Yamaguchi]|nr:hemolysin-type calcium-binding protein [Methylopila sp. Yamaguchi]